jgi:hypothetical protein
MPRRKGAFCNWAAPLVRPLAHSSDGLRPNQGQSPGIILAANLTWPMAFEAKLNQT